MSSQRLRYTIIHPGRRRQEVNDDLTKPFYVGHKSSFCGVDRHGYLPAIERPEQPSESTLIDELLETVATLRDQVSANNRQLPFRQQVTKRTQTSGNTLDLSE